MNFLSNLIDVLAFAYLLVVVPVPLFWLVFHGGIGFWRRWGTRSYWVALPVWVGAGVALSKLHPWMFAERFPRNAFTAAAGLVLCAAGVWIMKSVGRAMGYRRLIGMREIAPEKHPMELVTGGIYARLRHPRYTDMLLTLSGLSLLSGAWGVAAAAGLTSLGLGLMVLLEERELRLHYGRLYEDYQRAVPRFIPHLFGGKRMASAGTAEKS